MLFEVGLVHGLAQGVHAFRVEVVVRGRGEVVLLHLRRIFRSDMFFVYLRHFHVFFSQLRTNVVLKSVSIKGSVNQNPLAVLVHVLVVGL